MSTVNKLHRKCILLSNLSVHVFRSGKGAAKRCSFSTTCKEHLRTDLHGRLKNSKMRDGKLQEVSTG